MKKLIICFTLILFLTTMVFVSTTSAVAIKMYGRDALVGGTKSVDNIVSSTLNTGDTCIVIDSSKALYFYRFNADSVIDGDDLPWVIEPNDDAVANTNGDWELVYPRDIKKLDIVATDETPVAITAANILANKYITNQGSSSEADWTMPDIEYYASVVFIVNEAFIMEICPVNADAHEAFDLDGVVLGASDCIDSPIVVGSKMVATRMQIADGTWKWSFDSVRGVWVDTGATD